MPGSDLLRTRYLDPASAAVPWLLDPASPAVGEELRAAGDRTPHSLCDPAALAADLPDFLVLLRERHFGLATGIVDQEPLDAWAATWVDRLTAERPRTWGTALGSDLHRLRWLVGDNHLRAVGEDAELLRDVNPRGREPAHGRESGPCVEEQVLAGVLCIRIRQCGAPTAAAEQLMADFQAAHPRHFAHDRIVVDVRSNPGGGDGFVRHWIGDYVPRDVTSVADQLWRYDDQRLSNWNLAVGLEAVDGPDGVPPGLRQGKASPGSCGKRWAPSWSVVARVAA